MGCEERQVDQMVGKGKKSWLRNPAVWSVFVCALLGIVVFLYGNGIFNKPKIEVACGAIDLGVPAKQMMDIMMIRFSLSTEETQKKLMVDLPKYLRDFGMPEEKITAILKEIKSDAEKSTLELTSAEEKILRAAYTKATGNLMRSLGKEYTIPDAVLFFEIDNTGRAQASNPHVVVRVDGDIYNHTLDSDNKVLHKVETVGELSIDLQSLSPGSKTKGIVWLCVSGNNRVSRRNEVTVSHDSGTVRQEFSIDDFYLRRN